MTRSLSCPASHHVYLYGTRPRRRQRHPQVGHRMPGHGKIHRPHQHPGPAAAARLVKLRRRRNQHRVAPIRQRRLDRMRVLVVLRSVAKLAPGPIHHQRRVVHPRLRRHNICGHSLKRLPRQRQVSLRLFAARYRNLRRSRRITRVRIVHARVAPPLGGLCARLHQVRRRFTVHRRLCVERIRPVRKPAKPVLPIAPGVRKSARLPDGSPVRHRPPRQPNLDPFRRVTRREFDLAANRACRRKRKLHVRHIRGQQHIVRQPARGRVVNRGVGLIQKAWLAHLYRLRTHRQSGNLEAPVSIRQRSRTRISLDRHQGPRHSLARGRVAHHSMQCRQRAIDCRQRRQLLPRQGVLRHRRLHRRNSHTRQKQRRHRAPAGNPRPASPAIPVLFGWTRVHSPL